MVSHGGHRLASSGGGQFSKDRSHNLPGHISEGIAVEEEKGRAAMALPQEFYEFGEGEDLLLFFCPLSACRCLSLLIKSVLRASSSARSSIEADDKLPTPVFEKSGSGL